MSQYDHTRLLPSASARVAGCRAQAGAARLATVVALLVVTVLGLELAARVVLDSREPPPRTTARIPGAAREQSLREDDPIPADDAVAADPWLLWRNRPSFERSSAVIPSTGSAPARWTLRLNSSGFRGDERAESAGDDRFRILCIGDSVTQGFNVDQHGDYPAVLAQLLHERYPRARFEVINAGVPEWSWIQGETFLLREGFALRLDLVVAAFGTADQLQPATITDSERLWLIQELDLHRGELARWLARSSALWRLLEEQVQPAPPRRASTRSPACRLQLTAGRECRRVSFGEIGAAVLRIGESAASLGVDALFINLDFAATGAAAVVHAAAIREGMPFLDEVARFRNRALRLDMVHARDLGLAFPRVPMVPFGRIGPPAPEGRGPRVRFRVLHSGGGEQKPAALRVSGKGPPDSGFRFDATLRDDATGGDEKAGDSVYSAFVEAAREVTVLQYRFYEGDRPEFAEPPAVAESNTDRTIRFNRDSDATIETFGVRPLMSDELHPDAQGQQRIAADILAEIEKLPSFRRVSASRKVRR